MGIEWGGRSDCASAADAGALYEMASKSDDLARRRWSARIHELNAFTVLKRVPPSCKISRRKTAYQTRLYHTAMRDNQHLSVYRHRLGCMYPCFLLLLSHCRCWAVLRNKVRKLAKGIFPFPSFVMSNLLPDWEWNIAKHRELVIHSKAHRKCRFQGARNMTREDEINRYVRLYQMSIV